ncbi:MAG TPA: hypothetical protein VMR02_16085, partial [Terracidiphilus sp.]|nr:hypothetical protein [Terracidiphilus sp.]
NHKTHALLMNFHRLPRHPFTLPNSLRSPGSVNHLSRQSVKDVLRLNTENAEGWGTLGGVD